MPQGLELLREAGPWDHGSMPEGLRRSHRIAQGVWGLLIVHHGRAAIRMETQPPIDCTLEGGSSQPIPPGVAHEVQLFETAHVGVQFWGRPNG